MWAPIVSGICQCLAMCPDIPVVFLSWGAKADRFLNKADIAPCVQLKTHVIARNHPSTVGFLKKPNVFRHITRGVKAIGKRSAGKPHAAFDEAGVGNVVMGAELRPRAKAMEQPPDPKIGAPVPDPTDERG